jgi:hypothetical protein
VRRKFIIEISYVDENLVQDGGNKDFPGIYDSISKCKYLKASKCLISSNN